MPRLRVRVDDRTEEFWAGGQVRDLIGRLPAETQNAIRNGMAYLGDLHGHELGDEGGLEPEGIYRVYYRG